MDSVGLIAIFVTKVHEILSFQIKYYSREKMTISLPFSSPTGGNGYSHGIMSKVLGWNGRGKYIWGQFWPKFSSVR